MGLSTTSCLSTLLLLLLLLMMRSSTLIMALFALFGYVAARPEMNCYMAHQSANIAFSHREQFELTLNANNGLQREYLCYCVDQSTTCERLDCRWVRKEEEGGGGGASSSRDALPQDRLQNCRSTVAAAADDDATACVASDTAEAAADAVDADDAAADAVDADLLMLMLLKLLMLLMLIC